MAQILLVTGGARSGKSQFALQALESCSSKAFIATSVAMDIEMAERIARHKTERGSDWQTIEEPTDLPSAIRAIPEGVTGVVIDCLTVWLGNLMHQYGEDVDIFPYLDDVCETLHTFDGTAVLVTNEVGVGIVPLGSYTRRYRDLAGWISQRIAKEASQVVLMVAGYPIYAKTN